MAANISKLYALNFLSGLVFWYPIEKLFLNQIGVDAFGVSINAVVFLVVQLCFDVPSGILADRWKRKYTLLLGMVSLGIGSLIGATATNLTEYLIATVFVGGFMVLTSGTFQAMVYDSLMQLGKAKLYDRVQGRTYALFLAGFGISALLGGYLAEWFGYRWTYAATAAVMLLAVAIALTLVEPTVSQHITDRQWWAHIIHAGRMVLAHRLLIHLGALVVIINIVRGAHNEYGALLFIALGLTAVPIGYATAVKWALSSLGQLVGPMLGRRALQLVPVFFGTSLAFSLIDNIWSLLFYFTAGFLYSVVANQAEAEIQDHTPSEIRATALSTLTFVSNLALMPLGLLFGWIARISDVFSAYLMIGSIGMSYLLVWFATSRSAIVNREKPATITYPV